MNSVQDGEVIHRLWELHKLLFKYKKKKKKTTTDVQIVCEFIKHLDKICW